MNYSNYRTSLDIHNTGSQALLCFNRNDNARKIVFVLTENGMPYKLTNDCSCVLSAIKPDGTDLVNSCAIDVEKGTITYDVTAQTTACAGTFECQLTITGLEGVISAPIFSMQVREIVINDIDLESTSEFNALVEMYNGFNDYTERIQDIENVAENMSGIIKAFNDGDLKGDKGDTGDLEEIIVQTTGDGETAVMSQKAVTDIVADHDNSIMNNTAHLNGIDTSIAAINRDINSIERRVSGDYYLYATPVVDEEFYSYTFDAPQGGGLRAVFIRLEIPAAETQGIIDIRFSHTNGKTLALASSTMIKTTAQIINVEAFSRFGKWEAIKTQRGNNYEATMQRFNNNALANYSTTNNSTISKVSITCATEGVPFPIGTKIYVYFVDEEN